MRDVKIQEVKNGYIVTFTKCFGTNVIERYSTVHNELSMVQQEITEYYQQD